MVCRARTWRGVFTTGTPCLHSPTLRDHGSVSATARTTRPRCTAFPVGRVRRSEGSEVACSHAVGCPLFPLLKASLQSWRDYYCDSEDRWRECARYQLALTGERVPISLLPNGRHAQHLRQAADAGRSGAADPRQAFGQAPPPRHHPGSAEPASWFHPVPPRQPEPPSRPGTGAAETTAQFEPAPPPAPAWYHRASPAPAHQPPPNPPEHPAPSRPQAPGSRRGWWARLVDWMRGPA